MAQRSLCRASRQLSSPTTRCNTAVGSVGLEVLVLFLMLRARGLEVIAVQPILPGEEIQINYKAPSYCPTPCVVVLLHRCFQEKPCLEHALPSTCMCGAATCRPPDPDCCTSFSCSHHLSSEVYFSGKVKQWAATCALTPVHKSVWIHGSWVGSGCHRGMAKAGSTQDSSAFRATLWLCRLCSRSTRTCWRWAGRRRSTQLPIQKMSWVPVCTTVERSLYPRSGRCRRHAWRSPKRHRTGASRGIVLGWFVSWHSIPFGSVLGSDPRCPASACLKPLCAR